MTALMAAAFAGNTEGAKLLVEKEKGISNTVGLTAIMLAATAGRTDVVRLLKDFPEERDSVEP